GGVVAQRRGHGRADVGARGASRPSRPGEAAGRGAPSPERGLAARGAARAVRHARACAAQCAWLGCVAARRRPAVRAPAPAHGCFGDRAMTHPTDGTCVFCKIVAGQIPCFKLLEDANTIAFMDINPVNPGHALAVAKGHWPTVDVIPPDVLAEVAQTAQ